MTAEKNLTWTGKGWPPPESFAAYVNFEDVLKQLEIEPAGVIYNPDPDSRQLAPVLEASDLAALTTILREGLQ